MASAGRAIPQTCASLRRCEEGIRAGGGRSRMLKCSRASTMLLEALERSSFAALTRAALEVLFS